VVWGPQGKDTATCDQFFAVVASPATRWIRSADRSGTNCALWTRPRPRTSKAPGGAAQTPPASDRYQAATLRTLRRHGGAAWRADGLKESLERWCANATRSRLEPFVKLTGTVRTHRAGILAAIRLGINNARVEAFNNKVRLITRRAYGFHSAQAALALVMLACGPITLCPPHGQTLVRPPAVK
jgi:hypothetical protein